MATPGVCISQSYSVNLRYFLIIKNKEPISPVINFADNRIYSQPIYIHKRNNQHIIFPPWQETHITTCRYFTFCNNFRPDSHN